MRFKISNRHILFAAIIIFYLIPLLFFSAYSIHLMSHNKSWALLSLGILLAAFGTLSLIFLLSYWEQTLQEKKIQRPFYLSPTGAFPYEKEPKVTSLEPVLSLESPLSRDSISEYREEKKEFNLLETALKDTEQREYELRSALDSKNREIEHLVDENRQLEAEIRKVAQDFADYKLFSEEQLKQKQLQISANLAIVEDQRTEMEKRLEQIQLLDGKVKDLSYEIRTLLDLNEDESSKSPPPTKATIEETHLFFSEKSTPHLSSHHSSPSIVKTPAEAAQLLKKCINVAQKMTGANHYGTESSRYREFSSSFFAIDQRRLFEALRGETGALVTVYSQKEQKLVFANNEAKNILGWSPEKLLADFSAIALGIQDWKKALHALTSAPESQTRMLAKTKQGHEVLLNCHLGVIPSGLFRNYVIAVSYRS